MQNRFLKSHATLVLALLMLPVFCALASAQSTSDTVRVVMNSKYPPFSFVDDAGNLKGILVDEWRLWEQRTHRRVELHAMEWEQAQRRMGAGEFDVIEAIFLHESRDLLYSAALKAEPMMSPWPQLNQPPVADGSLFLICGSNLYQTLLLCIKQRLKFTGRHPAANSNAKGERYGPI